MQNKAQNGLDNVKITPVWCKTPMGLCGEPGSVSSEERSGKRGRKKACWYFLPRERDFF
jgi:hypothetical protein